MKVAISGMAVHFPGCPDLRSFEEILLGGHTLSDCEQKSNGHHQSLWQVCQQALADAALPLNQNIVTLFPETNQEEIDIPMDLATSAVSLPAGPGWLFLAWKQAHYILSENSHDAVVIAAEDESGCGAAAVVFQRLDDAKQVQSRVYAVIGEWNTASAAGSLEIRRPVESPIGRAGTCPVCAIHRSRNGRKSMRNEARSQKPSDLVENLPT